MITAVLHYPSVFQPPAGIWWWDAVDNVPRNIYLPGNDSLKTAGTSLMAGVQSQAQFDYWSQRMADRTDDGDLWGTIEIDQSLSPLKYLKMAQKQTQPAA